ncbi:alpha/beta hydrolase [Nocardia sp. NBC_01377]
MVYAFDPELAPWTSMIPTLDFADLASIRDMLRNMSSMNRDGGPTAPRYEPPTPVAVRDTTAPGPRGAPDVPVRIYRPEESDAPLPGLLYIHGGGFVMGNLELVDHEVKRIASEVGVVVVCVDYRLAPENPFPAPPEDCYAALTWTAEHAEELGIDPERLAVGGESAGAGLAAAVTLLARDRGGPTLCFQYLAVPELDDRLGTPSMRDYHDTPIWHRSAAEFSWDSYLGPGVRGTDGVSAYAAPARAEDLSDLPPAFVSVCQFDPLRDEGIAYAQRLAQANIPTELVLYPGTFHGTAIVQQAAITRRIVADQIAALHRALHAGAQQ